MPTFNELDPGVVLYGIRVTPGAETESVRAFTPDLGGVAEVFHAAFTDHTYPLHSHEAWTVLIVDNGAVRYDLDHHNRGADTRRVTVLPPYVAHNGESARPGRGFRKRVLYLDVNTIGESLVGKAVDNSTLDDPLLRDEISRLHKGLDQARNDLEWETRLGRITERIQRRLRGRMESDNQPLRSAAVMLREYLEARIFQRHRLDEVAAELGWNKTHLVRSFTAEYGIPPHRYLISRRVEEARKRLLAGQPAAQVAVEVGFYDQAHLSRHFRAHLAITPGRFQDSTRQPRSL